MLSLFIVKIYKENINDIDIYDTDKILELFNAKQIEIDDSEIVTSQRQKEYIIKARNAIPDTINSILYNRYLLLIIFLFCLLCQAPMCLCSCGK